MFFLVEYKPVNRALKKTIVKADSSESATLMFNNPKEIGLNAEIKKVKKAKAIPSGWYVSYSTKDNPFPVTGKTPKGISLEELEEKTTLLYGKNNIEIKIKEIVSAYKPGKDKGVMKQFF